VILTCIVTHDRLAYTKRCIRSYLRTRRPEDRLVVVDNASTERGMATYLRGLDCLVLRNATNRYPGAATNQGWEAGLQTWQPDFLHRSDNDIEYLPGWGDEVEATFAEWPELALLGILNLHEDHGAPPPGAKGIKPVPRVGGNVVMPARLYPELRWAEGPWKPGQDEDGPMSWAARKHGWVAHLVATVANNMAFGRYSDYPAYYDRTAAVRGISDAEHSV